MYNVEVAPCVSISYNTVKRVFIDRKEIQSLSNHPENWIILTDRDRQMMSNLFKTSCQLMHTKIAGPHIPIYKIICGRKSIIGIYGKQCNGNDPF